MAKRMITFQGKTMCLAAWARYYKIGETTLWHRLERGETMRDAVFAPTNDKSKPIQISKTQALTPKQIAKAAKISVTTVHSRKKRGWKAHELLRESCGPFELTAFGKTQSCVDWAKEYHVTSTLIRDRLRRGWNAENAISTPVGIALDAPEAFGRKQPLCAWCEEFDISIGTVKGRLRSGLPLELALKIRPEKIQLIEIGDKAQSLAEWARETGIPEGTIRYRYHQGVTGEDLIKGKANVSLE